MADVIDEEHWNAGMSYPAYRQLIDDLLLQDKTTGSNQSASYIEFTKLNVQRMRRLDKTAKPPPEVVDALEQISQPRRWCVLTEAWCGDAAQSVPVIAHLAAASPTISLRLLLKDEHPEVMDAYLTQGARSIPKMVCLTPDLQEIGTWGPRPVAAQQILRDYKEKYGDRFREHYQEFTQELHLWYAKDRTSTVYAELKEKIISWSGAKPKV